jgi:hypothetical protein
MLKLFTDLTLLSLGDPVVLLFPFIGIPAYDLNPENVVSGRFEDFYQQGKKYIQLTDIESCDACFLPIYFPIDDKEKKFQNGIAPFLKLVKQSGKKIFVFTGHDVHGLKINIENAIIFNGAINKSEQAYNVFSWPHFFEDYIQKYYNGKTPLRSKENIPVVGFCGYAPPLGIRFGKEKLVTFIKLIANYIGLMKLYPTRSSHSYRARALLAAKRSKKVKTNFKIKPFFAFGPGGLNTGKAKESNDAFRRNFVQNIVESDYTICVRGLGNNSVRFFETICCGRIPVFVNTDSVLPFDHIINWKKYSVWIEEKDIDKVGDRLYEFHKNISPEEFFLLQKELRTIWEEYFSPLGFFKSLKLFLHQETVYSIYQKNPTVNSY